jgi:hypothetical protein
MRLKCALALALLTCGGAPAAAQTLSPTADFSMWCATALARLEWKGVLDAADRVRADAAIGRHRDVVLAEAEKTGIDKDGIDFLVQSYADEIIMQVDEYVQTRSKDALRIDIDACY